jgi:methionine synthase I (cobalamin-dependent)
MADEPENMTLKLLREMRAESQAQAKLLGKAMDALMELAQDVKAIRASVKTISEVQKNQGARLNVIEGRLAIIEQHTGLVKA